MMPFVMFHLNWLMGFTQAYVLCTLPAILWYRLHSSKGQQGIGGLTTPPVWGPWYLPPFVRGIIAMIKLGTDEDRFLLSAKATYGDVVYIPWPMKQVFLLSAEPIQYIYSTTSKQCIHPILTRMLYSVFGVSRAVPDSLLTRLFHVHTKGLVPIRIPESVSRFANEAKKRIEELASAVDANNGSIEVHFVEWMRATVFASGTAALFGEDYSDRMLSFNTMENLADFDDVFGLLASEMMPLSLTKFFPAFAQGKEGKRAILERMYDWIAEGTPGLEEGDVVKAIVDHCNEAGTSLHDTATLIFSDFWALQANAPWAAIGLLIFVIQSPILGSILKEIDQLPVDSNNMPELSPSALDKMDLATSCFHETLRLWTTSYSKRVNPEATIVPVSLASAEQNVKCIIPPKTEIICATRASHLTDEAWGEDPQQWDGTRFLKRDGDDDKSRERKFRRLWGFGGGRSICAGRHFASYQLKTMLTLLLSTFDIVPLYATAEDGKTRLQEPTTKLNIKGTTNAFAPILETRPGLGALRCKGKSDIVVRMTRRKL